MKGYKAQLHQQDYTADAAITNVTYSYVKQKKIKSYGELTVYEEGTLHGELTFYTREYLERHPLERKTLELKNDEYREVLRGVNLHNGKLTRQHRKRLGLIPSVRCK